MALMAMITLQQQPVFWVRGPKNCCLLLLVSRCRSAEPPPPPAKRSFYGRVCSARITRFLTEPVETLSLPNVFFNTHTQAEV